MSRDVSMEKVDKDEQQNWLAHPHTNRLRSEARTQVLAALSHLRGVCASSTDPEVAKAYGRLQAAEVCERIFTGRLGGEK